ncbi:MAG: heat-inducible transcriptional repressor HrcA [Rhodospirillales bacterium]|nr:heat-inducible transcriptional repressor HrcA [Rhodospirillales bacterium]MCW8862882.1 heat-inducible transcriptional repressor HrcA [Rhodospirillales bacterium]MCW9003290.1 heat-inducible transcriptional repressor HrcA [Rhodospirillales bacterium]
MITELNERSREIFRQIVDAYMETGEPVGSRTISRRLDLSLSPATIRNVMADLEDSGLLYSPHTSAGRMPTDLGLRLFVDGILEVGDIGRDERAALEANCAASGRSIEEVLKEATGALSGLSGCTGLVAAPKSESPLKHIEFLSLSPGRALVVMVNESGVVENRVLEIPGHLPPSALVEATNYLSARLVGRTLSEARGAIKQELENHRSELDALTSKVVEAGLAVWGGDKESDSLIVRGQSRLLSDVNAMADLERIRALFEALETRETMARLLDMTEHAEGVQIFIGADSPLFNLAGCSMVVSPFRDGRERIVGAIGIIGPTRINYARVIPMVDFTAKLVGRLIG